MIFNKKIYSSSGLIKSFFKRLSLLSLKNHSRNEVLTAQSAFPFAKSKLTSLDVDELNELCHTKAFSFKKEALLNTSRCNSCQDCAFHSKVEFRTSKVLEKYLKM